MVTVEKSSVDEEFDFVDAVFVASAEFHLVVGVDAYIEGTRDEGCIVGSAVLLIDREYFDFLVFAVDGGMLVGGIYFDSGNSGCHGVGVRKVEVERIDGLVVFGETDFVVQMRACRASGVACQSHELTFFHRYRILRKVDVESEGVVAVLVVVNEASYYSAEVAEVHVDGLVAVRVSDIQYFAAAPCRDVDAADVAVVGSVDLNALFAAGADVDAGMEVVRTNFGESAGHRERQLDRHGGESFCVFGAPE